MMTYWIYITMVRPIVSYAANGREGIFRVLVNDLSGIQTDPKTAQALGEVYLGVKPNWSLVWVPSPLSSRQRYLP